MTNIKSDRTLSLKIFRGAEKNIIVNINTISKDYLINFT